MLQPVAIMAHQPVDPSAVATVSIARMMSSGRGFFPADRARDAEAEDPRLAKLFDEVARHTPRLLDLLAPRANRGKELPDTR